MNNSSYLQLKMESNKKIALSLEKGIHRLQENGREVLGSIYSGAERASWYSSCFFDKYDEICKELKEEDKRMFLAIKELYKRKDVILFMIELYVLHLLEKKNEKSRNNIVLKVTGMLANNRAKLITNMSISYVIAKKTTESMKFTIRTRTVINNASYYTLMILEFYSIVQKAAMSARKLKTFNPVFYQTLYSNNLEMLYFVIEPIVQKNIGRMNSALNENDIISILKDMM